MTARSIGYWITTALFALALLGSGLGDLVHAQPIVEGIAHLGYPVYLATLLGIWKVLGVAAILVPRFPRLKEWAYAGFAFELTGAAFSHVSVGEPGAIVPLVLLAIGVASWALRPEDRRLGELLPSRSRSASRPLTTVEA
jgi:uncharacterized membrane protein YphA (DoxX/SURF4 family)